MEFERNKFMLTRTAKDRDKAYSELNSIRSQLREMEKQHYDLQEDLKNKVDSWSKEREQMETLIRGSHQKIQEQQTILAQNKEQIYDLTMQSENAVKLKNEAQALLDEADNQKSELKTKLLEQQNDIIKLREYIKSKSLEENEAKMQQLLKVEGEKKELEQAVQELEGETKRLKNKLFIVSRKGSLESQGEKEAEEEEVKCEDCEKKDKKVQNLYKRI